MVTKARARPKKTTARLKTQPNDASVTTFLNGIADEQRRKDAFAVLAMVKKITKAEPKMWGSAMVGFGQCHYEYASGRGGDWFLAGFSPRKAALVLYLMTGIEPHRARLKSLGKHKTGKGCLYIPILEDVDQATLAAIIEESVASVRSRLL